MIKKQFLQLLFLLGPCLLIAGLTSGLISEEWGAVSLGLVIVGLVICCLWIITQTQKNHFWKRRSTEASTNGLIATLAVIVILGLINFLGVRYHLRTDLTENQLFTLAPQSRELVHNLSKPVMVWVFARDENTQDRELLENYRRQSSKFNFAYVDPEARPKLAEKFGVKDFGEVYLELENKHQLVQTINESEPLSEINLTNHLQQALSSKIEKAYFLQGHGEHQLTPGKGAISQAIQGLSSKNFTASPLNFTEKQKVPEDAAVVIVAGPQRMLLEGEVKALQDYLSLGGNLLLMIDPNTDPKIDNLLKDWGVILDNRLAIDVSGESLGLGPAAPLVTDYGKHPITKDFGNGISFYRLARPLSIKPVPNVESSPLLLTKPYPKSWAEIDQQSEKLEFHQGDIKGPLVLGVALTKKILTQPISQIPSQIPASPTPLPLPTIQNQTTPKPTTSPKSTASPTPTAIISPSPITSPTPASSPTPTPTPITSNSQANAKESRLVVLGNSDFATDGLFQQQLNGDVFLNSVIWLSQQDQATLSIRPKEPRNRRINFSTTQANILTLSSLLLLPFIGLTTATIIWWKRR